MRGVSRNVDCRARPDLGQLPSHLYLPLTLEKVIHLRRCMVVPDEATPSRKLGRADHQPAGRPAGGHPIPPVAGQGPLGDPQVTPIPLKSVGLSLFGISRPLLDISEALAGPFEEHPTQPVKPDVGQGR